MKKIILTFILILSSLTFSQNYFYIEELRGLEDSLGNTKLFYRQVLPTANCWIRSIYHFDVNSSVDTLFIYDAAVDPIGEGCRGQYVFDYEFLNNNSLEFAYGGFDFFMQDAVPIFIRYDGQVPLPPLFPFGGAVTEVELSSFNSNIIYLNVLQFGVGSYLLKSTDAGYNFVNLNNIQVVDFPIISLSKIDSSEIYGTDNLALIRTTDEGTSYSLVNNYPAWDYNSELFYDIDRQYIYGITNYQGHSSLQVSDQNGDEGSWSTQVEVEGTLPFTFDEETSGEIYYSTGKQIFKSTDYGTTFGLYKTLDRNVTGLYKKSGTNILYASTPLKIYEITPTDIEVIKELPIPQEVYDWYPLEIGNLWAYEDYYINNGNQEFAGYSWEIITDFITLGNSKDYFELVRNEFTGIKDTLYLRLDEQTAEIYLYDFSSGNDLLYENLFVETGDTICYEYPEYWDCQIVQSEEPFSTWGLNTQKRIIFPDEVGFICSHSLVNEIGKFNYGCADLYGYSSNLIGCVIDGTVYGDTSVVSVESKIPEIPSEYSLLQNYPNPFNPTTKISWQAPVGAYQTLKIFDVLGKEIATLVDEYKPAGRYEVEFDASSLPSGIYFYQLKAGLFVETKKMIMLK